jgi:hypothetical protein
MIALFPDMPEEYRHIVSSLRGRTQVSLAQSLIHSGEGRYNKFRVRADHLFMVGYVHSLYEVVCAGSLTVVCDKGLSNITGAIHYAGRDAHEALGEACDILSASAERFSTNHPHATSTMSAIFKPYIPSRNVWTYLPPRQP